MIENIKTAFLDILENVDWMDTDTRSEAKQKVSTGRLSALIFRGF